MSHPFNDPNHSHSSRLHGNFRGQLYHRIWQRFRRRMSPPWLDLLLPSRANRLSVWNPPNMDQGLFRHRYGWTRRRPVASRRFPPKRRPGEMRGSRQRRTSPRFYCYSSLSSHQTVGTLLSGAYSTGSCLLGAIFGTGTNGAYVEDQGALKKLSGNTAIPGDGRKMIINCEWGAFDSVVSFHKRQSSLPSLLAHSEKFSLCLNSTQSSIANPSIRMRVST